jgi:hypothetical protein
MVGSGSVFRVPEDRRLQPSGVNIIIRTYRTNNNKIVRVVLFIKISASCRQPRRRSTGPEPTKRDNIVRTN